MRLLRFPDLVDRGIVNSRMTLKRLIDNQGFPTGRLITPNSRAWTEEEVNAWVADVLACAPLAVRAIKQCVAQGFGRTLEAAMTAEYPLEILRRASSDSVEGPRAFAEKRAPVWTGQ